MALVTFLFLAVLGALGLPFGLREQGVIFKHGVDIRGYILWPAPRRVHRNHALMVQPCFPPPLQIMPVMLPARLLTARSITDLPLLQN